MEKHLKQKTHETHSFNDHLSGLSFVKKKKAVEILLLHLVEMENPQDA